MLCLGQTPCPVFTPVLGVKGSSSANVMMVPDIDIILFIGLSVVSEQLKSWSTKLLRHLTVGLLSVVVAALWHSWTSTLNKPLATGKDIYPHNRTKPKIHELTSCLTASHLLSLWGFRARMGPLSLQHALGRHHFTRFLPFLWDSSGIYVSKRPLVNSTCQH